jgi:tetratricopeptide (TPR) repeat protein
MALAMVPDDYHMVAVADMDEVFQDGWRAIVEDIIKQADELVRIQYTYYHRPNKVFIRDAIHPRHGYFYRYPCHEVIVPYEPHKEKLVLAPEIVQRHFPDLSKPRGQYLRLLELSAKENPDDSHVQFNLLREYFGRKQFRPAKLAFQAYRLCGDKFAPEHGTALRYAAEIATQLEGPTSPKRLQHLDDAVRIAPELRDVWVDRADAFADLGRWADAEADLLKALEIKQPLPLSVCEARFFEGYTEQLLEFVRQEKAKA